MFQQVSVSKISSFAKGSLRDAGVFSKKDGLDYSPYGTLLHGRHGTQTGSDSYRYAFQGQEKDDEIKGEGNSYNYTYRMHDPRIGRFFATDPLTAKYPWYTPYQFSGNKPIQFIELEGLEEDISGANSGGKSPEEMVKYLQSRIEANEAQIQNIEQEQQQQTEAITEQLNGEIGSYTGLLERNISTKQELMRMRQSFAEMAYVLDQMNLYFDYAEDPTNNQDANYYVQSFTPYKNLTEIFFAPVSTGGSPTDPSTMATGSCYPTTFAAPVVDYGKEKLSAGLQYAGMSENAANNTSEGVFFFASILISRKAPTGGGLWRVGPYNVTRGTVLGLDSHHVGQKVAMLKFVPGYNPKTAPSILVPRVGHTIRGPNGIVSRSTTGITNARQLVARDIFELRRVYGSEGIPNSSLLELIQMNKTMYPSAFLKK